MKVRPDAPLPPVDARLVMPETRYEVIDGQVVYVSPADPPHASRHSKVSALLEAYVRPGYDVASDMLTRTSEFGDMAPDASVYPSAPRPDGGRQLEELAFEVVSTERLSDAGTKADRLSQRGVRRVFAVDVSRQRALEWDVPTAGWRILADDEAIDDVALVTPLAVRDLVSAAHTDDAVAKALLSKENPVLRAALADSRVEGRAEGLAEANAAAVVRILRLRGLIPTADEQAAILAVRDAATLARWLDASMTCETVGALL